jgi:hypothetical protein
MTIKSLFSSSLLIASLFSFVLGCSSKKEAHLGQETVSAEIEEGVTLTQTASRELLPSGKIAGEDAALLQLESTVFAIDYNTRVITLKNAEGKPVEVLAGPEVKNFAQIKAGDKVQVEYFVSVAFEVRKPTQKEIVLAAEQTALTAGGRAKLGTKPAGAALAATLKIMNVEKIDKNKSVIVLRDINSQEITEIKAKYPENLDYVKAGDSVVVAAVEAIAAKVAKL